MEALCKEMLRRQAAQQISLESDRLQDRDQTPLSLAASSGGERTVAIRTFMGAPPPGLAIRGTAGRCGTIDGSLASPGGLTLMAPVVPATGFPHPKGQDP